ncbi:DUF427 domain-containing protein [Ancylobacter dichloromethanicus]
MMKAVWNGAVIAEADKTEIVEGNHYFSAGVVAERILSAQRYSNGLPVEGNCQLLLDCRR